MAGPMPAFARDLVDRLRRRGLRLGVDDCVTLRTALAAGHGLHSTEALGALCVALWATSRRDAEIITSTLHLVAPPDWSLEPLERVAGETRPAAEIPVESPAGRELEPVPDAREADLDVTRPALRGGGADPPRSGRPAPYLITRPQYPMSEREIAQAWRRLRRPSRHGPRTELDVEATVARYAKTGVVTAPVLMPRRINSARLLLLIDRQGSMTPFHNFVDHVTRSIVRAARLDSITIGYFRNSLGRSPDRSTMADLTDPLAVELDTIIDRIPPLTKGWIYDDPDLTRRRPARKVLDTLTAGAGVVIVSDAGAQRGSLVATRIFDAVALGLAVNARRARVCWLNPLATDRWAETSAAQIARHIPMFPLDRDGMYAAVDVLRGRPVSVAAPL
ncbi:VWA domain-containing protein [Actinoplanes sp. NPDC048796]|uniref:VWA domain-containing protein n=1 Tax=unclassified Actinoplanes TaxID=2626549 RepID=UPI0033ED8DE4